VEKAGTITLILAEAALETIPQEISGHPAVKNHAARAGAKWSQMLLDKSYHYAAMKKLANNGKRGRPDIVHFALMEALSTPLFMENRLRVYVHTVNDKIIAIADNLRIPKSFFRFEGLMVKLFTDGVTKSEDGAVLMELSDGTFASLLESVEAERVIGQSTTGVTSTAEQVARSLTGSENCAAIVGGFPRGHFGEKTTRYIGPTYSISSIGLEAHVVIARVVYECEKLLEKGVDHEGDK
jgi:rRNA small subunit pseudouridine methyltransferase Nep1